MQFNATQHLHFDQGYTVISHSSQGLTADWELINVATPMHPTSSVRDSHTSLSHARGASAEICTNDALTSDI
jgi:hypothetical protein